MDLASSSQSATFDAHPFKYIERTVRCEMGVVREVEFVSPEPIDTALHTRFIGGKIGELSLPDFGKFQMRCISWTDTHLHFCKVPEIDAQPTA